MFAFIRLRGFIAVLAFCSLPSTLFATTVRPLSLGELHQEAERVVVARVLESRGFWVGTRIFTEHRVERVEALRGVLPKQFRIMTLGGVVGDLGQRVEGAPLLRRNRTYVFFLKEMGGGDFYRPIGLWQGVAEVTSESGRLQPRASGATRLTLPLPQFPESLQALRLYFREQGE